MQDRVKHILTSHPWIHYLTRPFNLFGASLWHAWYISSELQNTIGVSMRDALFLEQSDGVIQNYRDATQLILFKQTLKKELQNDTVTRELLSKATDINQCAESLLQGKTTIAKLQDAVSFFVQTGIYSTIIPYFVVEFLQGENAEKQQLISYAKRLRVVSYYTRILDEIILPIAKASLKNEGIDNPEQVINFITIQELLASNFSHIAEHQKAYGGGKRFLYAWNAQQEIILYLTNNELQEIEETLEKNSSLTQNTVQGQCAYIGTIRGIARIINIRTWQQQKFSTGDILISINSNPTLMPLIQKAGALVTDEGGIACHAAIVSRELKIPCIVGTRIATKIFKDGDLIEVNAGAGTVRKNNP